MGVGRWILLVGLRVGNIFLGLGFLYLRLFLLLHDLIRIFHRFVTRLFSPLLFTSLPLPTPPCSFSLFIISHYIKPNPLTSIFLDPILLFHPLMLTFRGQKVI